MPTDDPVTVDARDLVLKMGKARWEGWREALDAVKEKARRAAYMNETFAVDLAEIDKLYRQGPLHPAEKAARMEKLRENLHTPKGLAIVEQLIEAGRAQGIIDRKTDVEVAQLVHEWAGDFDVVSPQHTLLVNIAERLERAAGGPTPDPDQKPTERT